MTAGVLSTVVVVTWRGRDLIGRCLDALAAQTRSHRLLVVDNASTDGTAAELEMHPARPAVLRLNRNTGYAGALAAALPHIQTPYMAWLNDDAEPEPTWLAVLEHSLNGDPMAAAAASAMYDGGGQVRSTGVALTPLGYGQDTIEPQPFGFCGGAALLRAGMLRDTGGVPSSLFCYYEDTDTSWRLRLAGHRVLAVPEARVRHLGGVTAGHGTPLFHRWNERNRLLVLLRCAPGAVAVRELVRFAGLTLVLPFRRSRANSSDVPDAPNFWLVLRLRVLAEVAARLPGALVARYRIGRRAAVARSLVWSAWAGRP